MITRRRIALTEFGKPDVMTWIEDEVAPPGEDEVLISIEAIGVNFGDLMVRRGEYRRDQSLDFTPGFEAAGTVLETCADGPQVGSRVVAFTENGGGYADRLVIRRDHVFTVDPEIDAVDAAALFVQGVTAWYAVHRYGRAAVGETALVHGGAGGLGGMCIQLCVAAGVKAIATASSEEKLEIAKGHGAAAAVLSNPETMVKEVKELTGGGGCDVVIDGIGGPLFTPSMRMLAFGGRFVVAGSATQEPAMLDVRALMPRGQTIAGFVVARVAEADPTEPQRAFDEVQHLLRQGHLRLPLKVFGPDELPRVHELLEGRRLNGKAVIRLGG